MAFNAEKYMEVDSQSSVNTPDSGKVRVFSKTDKQLYMKDETGWETLLSSGVVDSSFLDLKDTPSSYAGMSASGVRVNSGETAIEFYDSDSYIREEISSYIHGSYQFAIFNDTKSAGVNGGTFTSGAWRTRDLNTELFNTITGAVLGTGGDVLLLHMDGADNGTTFTDEYGRHTITPVGDACTKTATKKFGTASAYFDGTGDYLTVPISSDFNFGVDDFCIDFWIKPNFSSGTEYQLMSSENWSSGLRFSRDTDNTLKVQLGGSSFTLATWSPADQWYHLAFTRNGTDFRVFVDGTQLGATQTSSSDITLTGAAIRIGYGHYTGSPVNGYIDEFRISKGQARWTSDFTPPTESYGTNVLLLHMDGDDNGTTFTDSIGRHTITPLGDACTKTATKKFGTASAYFDGTGDYLSIPASDDLDFGTGDLTIDGWFRFDGTPQASRAYFDIGQGVSAGGIQIHQNTVNTLRLRWHSSTYDYTFSPVADTWFHLAVVRSGSTVRLYIDGTQLGSDRTLANDMNGGATRGAYIGNRLDINQYWLGHIDEFRITKGLALWTANFTPETTAWDLPEHGEYEANAFRLPAGTYLINASAPAAVCNEHTIKLVNITDTSDVLIGSGGRVNEFFSTHAFLKGAFTIASTKVFEIQHRCTTTAATNGFGYPCNFGVNEIYTQAHITKVG